ncbi:virulence factor SrfC family protein [uncultured Cohaesibacter sp.]|uniref:virulence factor SrfC family protein n=1 Tax=uncultured Cohaesibacter sp. TaxID=1002546 RepID=UPI002AAACB42|nr:virulence factor SrfC family protein [uncultured Cohaesibacter sp.]
MMIVNEQLLEKTKETASAAQEGVDWLKMPANVERIGEAAKSIERELKRGVVDALRLSEAATRPMAVAVFGASQVGKSHLISVLARSNDELYAVFDGVDEPVSYIKQINIDKEGESTGLVTRFTINKETTPAGFPVCLRWLSHADLIKIIANAYFFDGRPNSFPESAEIAEHVSGFSSAGTGGQNNGLKPEDVWDLQDYFTQYMSASALTAKLDAFWMAAADICPNLSIADLGKFFSILWGKEEPITKLYVDLVSALQRLDFPKTAYVPLAAIDATNPKITSIITVAGLSDISQGSSEQIEVKTMSGASASLPRSSVAALTAEILITIQDKPWDFFDHTDLLDFPGYRSRGLKAADFEEDADDSNLKGIAKYLAQNPDKTLQTLLLRGKVEYLFQRYVAEQEITSMLLCAQPNNLDVDQLPQVVAKWITATHGPKPEDRLNKEVLLFFIFTKFDLHFTRKTSDSSFGLEGRLGGAIENPLIQSYGGSADTWVKNWTPGQPFKNCYLMRNPNILNREIFDIDGQSETGVRESETGFLGDLKNTFISVEPVQEHFSDPAEAFAQMMELNDGGASHIARNLSPVCNPEIKKRQIEERLKKLRERLCERLSAYYVSSDSSVRLDERLAVADQVLQELYVCDERMRFSSLLRGLMLDPGMLASRLHEASLSRAIESRSDDDSDASQAVASVAPSRPRPGAGRVRPRPTPGGGRAPASAAAEAASEAKAIQTPSKAPTKNRQRLLAEAAIVTMIENLFEQADNPSLAALTGVSADALREIAKEIALAVRRVKLTDSLAEQIARIAFVDRRDELLNKATLAAEHMTNGFIADLGMSLLPEEKRAVIDYETGSQPVFKSRAVAFDTSGISDEPDAFTTRYVDSWLHAFFKVVQDNALGDTLDVDPELNARLGGILERLSR